MNREQVLTFGKHEGQTMGAVMESDPGYILWLSGLIPKYAFSAAFQAVKAEHPDIIDNAKLFVADKCFHCWAVKDNEHRCSMSGATFYNFHPYGRR